MIQISLGSVVLVLAVWAILKRVDVRLSLTLAALVLGCIGGDPQAVVRKFLETFSDEKFVVPICSAMGFAYVMRLTECDQHLVHLLVRPLQRVRFLLIPGTVVVGFLVNMPIISQTSTAVTIGPVLIPILNMARIAPETTGAALLLGCSIGGELLNPGAPELRTTVEETQKADPDRVVTGDECVARILPLNIVGLVVATGLFWFLCRGDNHRDVAARAENSDAEPPPFQVNYLRAVVPLLPLLLLYLTAPPLKIVEVKREWLIGSAVSGPFDSRLVGLAMLAGVAVAAIVVRRAIFDITATFFEGAGYGFAHIISLIVAANCFGKSIQIIGLAEMLGETIRAVPALLLPLAGVLPLVFAMLCGSGMASTQSLFGFFAGPAVELGIDPVRVGAVVSLSAAAGRTMSPPLFSWPPL
jgi:DcuC family C4-dicarboxylate transporter